MKKRMIGTVIIIVFILAAYLVYAILKVRFLPSISNTRQDAAFMKNTEGLYRHVEQLSVHIGSRSVYEYEKIEESKKYIASFLEGIGYIPKYQKYFYEGQEYSNVIVSIQGKTYPEEFIVIGAHYDTVYGTPGADDNASAVAVLLEMARMLHDYKPDKTIRLVFFALEEPPVFRTEYMGSFIYASEAKSRQENIIGMICLEMLGYYSDKKGGQTFPLPLMSLIYPTTPDFIAVVGNFRSRSLLEAVSSSIKKHSSIPVETLSTFSFVPGVDFSDHRSFWEMGYPAVMITDTAFFRNPNYHSENDKIDTLDFDRMYDLLIGLVEAAKELSSTPSE